MTETDVFVGIDWAHAYHQVYALDRSGNVLDDRVVQHEAEELAAMCDRIADLVDNDLERVAIAIETTHGIVVETLLERGLPVFSINPKQLDRFRDRFSMSGAKDDRRDARVLADSLRTDRRAFRRLAPDDPTIVHIREFSRIGDDLQQERTRLTNRMRDVLRRYFPAILELTGDVGSPWFLGLLELAPTPAAAAEVKEYRVRKLLKQHRIRKVDTSTVLECLRRRPMVSAPGTAEALAAHLAMLIERVRVVDRQLRDSKKQIERLLKELEARTPADDASPESKGEQRDVTIARSMPGVGPTVIATLLAEASRPLANRDYPALRALSGVAPVTKRSGKRLCVHRRHGRNHRLENAMYHAARVASQRDVATKAAYAYLRSKGHTHGRALRTIGDRMLRALCAMLRDQTSWRPRTTNREAA